MTVAPHWLFPRVEALRKTDVGFVTVRAVLMNTPEQINACGNEMSPTRLTFCIGAGETAERFQTIPDASKGAFAMRYDCYEHLGGFASGSLPYF